MKTILTNLFIISISIIGVLQNSNAQCHIDDWTALKALYESTDGDNWTDRIGWDTQIASQTIPPVGCDLDDLDRVSLDADGRVFRLSLNNNQLNGNIPPELGNLSNLWLLYLYSNQLTGNIPSELGNLNGLSYLFLDDNMLSGNIPPELGNLTNMDQLKLYNNMLSGNIPPELGNLNNLSIFGLHSNQLSGCYSSNLTSWCNYGNAAISDGNNFDATWEDFCNTGAGACPTNVCHVDDWTALKALYESTNGDNWINRSGWDTQIANLSSPPANCDLRGLFGVYIGDGRVSTIRFYVNNNLSGNIPPQINKLTNLQYFEISDNGLTGPIPSEIGNLISLLSLKLDNNELTGSIPTELRNLTSLSQMDLNSNQLSGVIPTEFEVLMNLSTIDLSNNLLSGGILGEIWNMPYINTINLSNNNLSGGLPSSLGNLNLYQLNLSNNQLTGSLPSTYANLTNLSLANNQLSGCFPNSFIQNCSDGYYYYYYYYSYYEYDFSGNNFDASWEDFCANGSCNIEGCTNSCASNYNPSATIDDDSCILPVEPTDLDCYEEAYFNEITCIWEIIVNPPRLSSTFFNADSCYLRQNKAPIIACYQSAYFDEVTCKWIVTGEQPTKPARLACNEKAVLDELTCAWKLSDQKSNCNTDCSEGAIELWNPETCECEVVPTGLGCTDPNACNYNEEANCDNGNCFYEPCGDCIDDLIVNSNTPYQSIYESVTTITTQGAINIEADEYVEYRSNTITLNSGFSIKAGSTFSANNIACNSDEGMTILGEQLENPYTLENMQQAYDDIGNGGEQLEATDIYVRFLPNTIDDFKVLEDLGLDLWDTPFDYEILEYGAYYHDPSIHIDSLTYYYTTVKTDFAFPDSINHEIIDYLYIPEEDSISRNTDVIALENKALMRTGNYDDMISTEIGINKKVTARKYYPQGRILTRNYLTIDGNRDFYYSVPVKQVKVRSRRWFRRGTGYTDDNGYFNINKGYNKKAAIIVIFENNYGKIRGIRGYRINQMFSPVRKKIGKYTKGDLENVNYTFYNTRDAKSNKKRLWMATQTINAIREFDLYCINTGIGRPQQNLNMWLTTKITSDASAPMLNKINSQWLFNQFPFGGIAKTVMGRFLPDITYDYNREYVELTSDKIARVLYHEFAHAIHYAKVGDGYWTPYILYIVLNGGYGEASDNGSGRIAVSETFAEFIGRSCAHNRYPVLNSRIGTHLDYLEYSKPDWIAEGIMYDMTDMGEEPNYFTGVTDCVDAYTIDECYSAMDGDVLSLYDFCARILGENNSKQMQKVISLYDSYGIQ